MKTNILPALKLSAILLILFSFAYPLTIRGIAYLSKGNGNGATLTKNGKIIGFELIGQSFTKDQYFWGRPSAANYNATASAGSNKGTSNPEYLKTVEAKIDTFLVHNPAVKKIDIPAELVTNSGSGLDPDISPNSAIIQIPRIAKVRGIPIDKLNNLVAQHIENPFLGVFGPKKVNVLKLNLALDQLSN